MISATPSGLNLFLLQLEMSKRLLSATETRLPSIREEDDDLHNDKLSRLSASDSMQSTDSSEESSVQGSASDVRTVSRRAASRTSVFLTIDSESNSLVMAGSVEACPSISAENDGGVCGPKPFNEWR